MEEEMASLSGWLLKGMEPQVLSNTKSYQIDDAIVWEPQTRDIHLWKEYSPTPNIHTRKCLFQKFLDCSEPAKFIVIIAKLVLTFKIKLQELGQIIILNQGELTNIDNFSVQTFLADTNRRTFFKYFNKMLDPSIHLLPATCQAHQNQITNSFLTIIIQLDPLHQSKFQIKVITSQNFLYFLATNVPFSNVGPQLAKTLDIKFLRAKSVFCFLNSNSNIIDVQLVKYFMEKFDNAMFICELNDSSKIQGKQKFCSSINFDKHTQGYILATPNRIVFAKNHFIQQDIAFIRQKYLQYKKIDDMIFSVSINSKFQKNVFFENQFCVKIYGCLYNFIRNGQLQSTNISYIHREFIQQLIKKKNQIEREFDKEINNQHLSGHYPAKIEKGCKVCCACGKNKKKSKFKCLECSKIYSRDISLCLIHFSEYHRNIQKYIPKGVKKGAQENQLRKFKDQEVFKNEAGTVQEAKTKINQAQSNYVDIHQRVSENWLIIRSLKLAHYHEVKMELERNMNIYNSQPIPRVKIENNNHEIAPHFLSEVPLMEVNKEDQQIIENEPEIKIEEEVPEQPQDPQNFSSEKSEKNERSERIYGNKNKRIAKSPKNRVRKPKKNIHAVEIDQ